MDENKKGSSSLLRILSYILVAFAASFVTLILVKPGVNQIASSGNAAKLGELESIILNQYIGQADAAQLQDAAASAMVAATGDRWSYYIPAKDMKAHEEQKANAYVGIGVTIQILENDEGFDVKQVEPNGPAKEGGILPGDRIVAVDGQRIKLIGAEKASDMVAGEADTTVDITYLRDGQEYTVTLTRRIILTVVASGQMVTDTIGYIRINNFDDRCTQETVALIEQLEAEGAEAFVFDVRFNPGGYKHELVALLDYLLPEGVLFRSENYLGNVQEDRSDASCKNVPMAVLINSGSYSAAEFFAAALEEYGYGFTVGQATTGKGYFQSTIELSDGSAVNLSVGKYYTPMGVSLAEVGGLVPTVPVEVDEETAALIYGQMLEISEDAQIQAAVKELEKKMLG